MAEKPESFWPSDLPDPADPTPVALLKTQADLLADYTGGEIKGLVRMYVEQEMVHHSLYLTADALGDYRYELLSISYPALGHEHKIYPIDVEGSDDANSGQIFDDTAFRDWLRAELSSERVRSVLGTLKGYVRESRSAPIG